MQDKSCFSTVPHSKSESETDPFEHSQTRRAQTSSPSPPSPPGSSILDPKHQAKLHRKPGSRATRNTEDTVVREHEDSVLS